MSTSAVRSIACAALACAACGSGADTAAGGNLGGTPSTPPAEGGTAFGGAPGVAGTPAAGGSTGSSAGAAGSGGSTGGAGPAPGPCSRPPACDAPPPASGAPRAWRDPLTLAIVATGTPQHRGRDLFLNPGDPQWVIAKFAYGLSDKDLKNEEVDLFLDRGCQGAWEPLGTAITTLEGTMPTTEGIDDRGGRIYFEISPAQALAPGRHRVLLVVAGDHSSTEVFLQVVEPGARVFISDVDGTLTTAETEEFTALLTGALPAAQPDAADLFWRLVDHGYVPFYVTARPEFLVQRTREFLALHGFPPGIVHTPTLLTGATGQAAIDYKSAELSGMNDRGLLPEIAFGNTETDAAAYAALSVEQRIFLRFSDATHGGRRIEAYAELLSEADALPYDCR